MKRLTLIRHAAAASAQRGQEDRDRALEAAGVREAHIMGQRLHERRLGPERIVASHARRAFCTAQYLAQALGLEAEFVRQEPRLYLASAQELLALTRELGGPAQHLVLVGHNPGIAEFADALSGERSIESMPTGAVVDMHLEIEQWRELDWGMGSNVWFDYPRSTKSTEVGAD